MRMPFTITDFAPGEDRLHLVMSGPPQDVEVVQFDPTPDGLDVIVNGIRMATLVGVSVAQMAQQEIVVSYDQMA